MCTACLDKLVSDRLGEPSEAVHACRGDTHGARRCADGALPAGRRLTCKAAQTQAREDAGRHGAGRGARVLQRGRRRAWTRRARTCCGRPCRSHVCVGLHMSARAYHRILKLARTIVDLSGGNRSEGAAGIATQHLPPRLLSGRDSVPAAGAVLNASNSYCERGSFVLEWDRMLVQTDEQGRVKEHIVVALSQLEATDGKNHRPRKPG
jgi:hypothetical protein